jgi:hypothetical protein
MTTSMTIECDVHFDRRGRGARRRLEQGPQTAPPALEPGRTPRVTRLMALALRLDDQVRRGTLASHSEAAALGCVSRARVSQIMNLLNLAPDVVEALLFLPRTQRGRDPIHLRLLQPIASTFDWRKQRRLWRELLAAANPGVETADV